MSSNKMQSLIQDKIASIRSIMNAAPLQTTLTPAIQEAVLRLLASLDASGLTASGGSETQKSSARSEKAVLAMLELPVLPTLKPKKNVFSLPMSAGDFFGFKRVVEHRNECRFVMPEADGVYAIHQPYGSQANPDILLIDVRSRKIACQFGIEIKSGGPTWNTHIQTADRSMMYIAVEKKHVHYFFGDHVRDKDSLILALAWDELQRELADELNAEARRTGKKNMCVPYPKQEFRGLNLNDGREARHVEIKAWLQPSTGPSESPTVPEPHSPPA